MSVCWALGKGGNSVAASLKYLIRLIPDDSLCKPVGFDPRSPRDPVLSSRSGGDISL